MVNGLLIGASVLLLAGLAMLWTPGPGWPVLLAGVAVLLLAVAARVATR
ncbi:MAG TPA: PGPGW domain-containing protein [Actinomycetes bacterium]